MHVFSLEDSEIDETSPHTNTHLSIRGEPPKDNLGWVVGRKTRFWQDDCREEQHTRGTLEKPSGLLHTHSRQHLTRLCTYRGGHSFSHTKAKRSDGVVLVVCFLKGATSNPLFVHWGPKDPKQLYSDAIKLVLQNIFLASYYLFSHQTRSKLSLDSGY